MEEVLGGLLVLSDAETIAAIHAVRHLLSLGYQCSLWSKGYIKCIKCSLNTMFGPKLTKSSSCSRLWPILGILNGMANCSMTLHAGIPSLLWRRVLLFRPVFCILLFHTAQGF